MTATTPVQPNFTGQDATTYKTSIDDMINVLQQQAARFAPHEQATPDMTVRVEGSKRWSGRTLTTIGADSTGTITAPSSDPRIDRISVNRVSGAITVTTGSEDPSPIAPAIPIDSIPIAQIDLVVSQTSILNVDITDERDFNLFGKSSFEHERKTNDYTVTEADSEKFFEMDKGSAITLSLADAASILNEGWMCYVHNSGAGTLTIDTITSDLIDEVSSITLATGESTIILCDEGGFWTVGKSGAGAMDKGQLSGGTLSPDSGSPLDDLNVTAGEWRDDADTADLVLSTEQTKQIDVSWATGNDAGGMSSTPHPVQADTTYHFFIFIAGSIVESGFDTSVTGSNLASDHSATNLRRIGSVLTDSSSEIIPFTQIGDEFLLDVPLGAFTDTNPGTSALTRGMDVPTGLQVDAICGFTIHDAFTAGAFTYGLITSLDTVDTVPSISVNNIANGFASSQDDCAASVYSTFRVDTSAQIRYRLDRSDGNVSFRGTTFGWVDIRGRD